MINNPGLEFLPVTLDLHFNPGRDIGSLLAVLAQVYLFFRIRQAIGASRRSARFKSAATAAAGICIFVLFTVCTYCVARPIPWVNPPLAAQALFFYLPAIWGIGSICSALILLASQAASGLSRAAVRLHRKEDDELEKEFPDAGRRRFLQAGVGAFAAAPFVLSGYGAAFAGRHFEITEHDIPFGMPLRVVHLTDIHSGLYMTRSELRRYADVVNGLRPDVLLLTGDYVTNSAAFLPDCLEQMARVETRYGTFASLGNHDIWYCRPAELKAAFRQYDIPMLRNGNRVIQTARGPFAVAGIDDLRWGRPDLDGALQGIGADLPTILLSHMPEVFPRAAERRIALTLSGHYHGGQIKLNTPEGVISFAHLRTPYPEGLFRIDDSRLYVGRGIGTSLTPVRLNARPEITLLHLS